MFGDEEPARRKTQLFHHGTSPGAQILDGRAKHVVRRREEGLRVHIEITETCFAEVQRGGGWPKAMHVKEKPQEPEAETQTGDRRSEARNPRHRRSEEESPEKESRQSRKRRFRVA